MSARWVDIFYLDKWGRGRRLTGRGGVSGLDEEQAWRGRLARHGRALLMLARQHCGSEDAADAVQEGFVRFWKSRERAEDAAAYLFACVRSAAMDVARAAGRRKRREALTPVVTESETLFDDGEREELRQAVETALTTLPAEQREVVVMKIWGELTFAQIAVALAIKPDTAASRYRYAIAKLQDAMKQEAVK